MNAGGSLRKEQTILPLARFAYFEGANSPWEQRKESNLLLKDNETCDLTVCPLCYVVAGQGMILLSSGNEPDELPLLHPRNI